MTVKDLIIKLLDCKMDTDIWIAFGNEDGMDFHIEDDGGAVFLVSNEIPHIEANDEDE